MRLLIEVSGTNDIDTLKRFYFDMCNRTEDYALTFDYKIIDEVAEE